LLKRVLWEWAVGRIEKQKKTYMEKYKLLENLEWGIGRKLLPSFKININIVYLIIMVNLDIKIGKMGLIVKKKWKVCIKKEMRS
jgi:hypothetical protein